LLVEHLFGGYDEVTILHDINIRIDDETKSVGLIGPNGAGKTTLFKTISGLLKPKKGKIFYNGTEITHLPAHKRVEIGIAYVPAEKEIFPRMSVMEVLELGAYTKIARDRVVENLDLVFSLFPRLKERKWQKAGTLSGGEQQMLAIARGLMSSPELLLLDEPTTGLAPIIVRQIYLTINQLIEVKGQLKVFIAEQRINEVFELCDFVYVLESGKLFMMGTPENLKSDERIKKSYLGMT
jgi:branched-chain amino acid transport system ATP-binding protein